MSATDTTAASTCSVAGCDRSAVKRGWCSAHYMRNHRTGSPTGSVPRARLDIAGRRFGRLVATEPVAGAGWRCLCDCGRTRVARTADLTRGMVRECSHLGVAHGPLTDDQPGEG
ncbi:hypothetical protein [Gordonia sp. NB41Y]|uniref:hypothetical protein n=1 Tax=Gordonia sp. NB41Y TaxID=875808 RepID=UPI0006B19F95|nr:hypothetical protein [Gordonia sp. NB41Y]KOY49300.1 hypothetical protein ISGA_11080 [Gordonia sp. NB41Y]WLP90584.1 hypothetical protein Q9K23_24355 [Gordonia sp. NB41Y]